MTHADDRIRYLDTLRTAAMFGVIVIHTAAVYLYNPDISSPAWAFALFWDSLFRSSINIFFMISGALLLHFSRDESPGRFLWRRVKRILVPFFFWSVFYWIWGHRVPVSGAAARQIIGDIVSGPVYYHLWYIYSLMGIYLVTPVIRVFVRHAPQNTARYYLWIWFICTSLTAICKELFGLTPGIDVSYFVGFLGFFIGGYYLHSLTAAPRSAGTIAAVAVSGCILTFVGTYVLNTGTHAVARTLFYSYYAPPVILTTLGVFLLWKFFMGKHQRKFPGVFRSDDRVSEILLGIYFMHPVILDIITKIIGPYRIFNSAPGALIGIPVIALVVFGICRVAVGMFSAAKVRTELLFFGNHGATE